MICRNGKRARQGAKSGISICTRTFTFWKKGKVSARLYALEGQGSCGRGMFIRSPSLALAAARSVSVETGAWRKGENFSSSDGKAARIDLSLLCVVVIGASSHMNLVIVELNSCCAIGSLEKVD